MRMMFQYLAMLDHNQFSHKRFVDGKSEAFRSRGRLRILVTQLVSCLFIFTIAKTEAALPDSANFADYKIKAVYIHHFANFVHWPDKLTDIRFCCLGRDSVTVTLENLVQNKGIPGYASSFISLKNLSEASNHCEILYLTERKMRKLQRIPQYEKVLTVSSNKGFTKQGGMIELRSINNQVKPVIGLDNVERGRLTVSSQLLRISLHHDVQKGGIHD
ncbi:YfiR family protein [Photobacterium sp. J15]|uniref:YfiR family protein n=1 Tax=Photobacterium sp. J15 TaxID=265901 RepID=UPI0007E351A8|nr:YfiR family protein [Photobacterium sp. J15]